MTAAILAMKIMGVMGIGLGATKAFNYFHKFDPKTTKKGASRHEDIKSKLLGE